MDDKRDLHDFHFFVVQEQLYLGHHYSSYLSTFFQIWKKIRDLEMPRSFTKNLLNRYNVYSSSSSGFFVRILKTIFTTW